MPYEGLRTPHPDVQASSTSPGLREMKLNPITLAFSHDFAELEALFRADYYRKFLKQIRLSVLLAICFYSLFGILDAQLIPDNKGSLWFIRYAIVCPSLLCAFLLSFLPAFRKYLQGFLALFTTLAGLGIIAMIIIAPPPVNFSYYAGLILVFMFEYTFGRLRFVWATAAGWTIVASYEIAALWIIPTPIPILLNNNFFFISANIIGMSACYSIEYFARKDFFLARLLENEQEKVTAANRELEKRVADRTSQLLKTNEDLKQEIAAHKRVEAEKEKLQNQLQHAQKMEAIGTLAGGIAHDFNNILAAIMGYTEMALLRMDGTNRIAHYLRQVLKASHRAKELVHQILTFSRQKPQDMHSINVKPIVKETMELLRASLPKNIEIRQIIEPHLYTIAADPTQIHQVLMNLCTNAAHAMEDEGGILEVSLKNVEVGPGETVAFPDVKPGSFVKLTVKDTGHGIDPSVLARIFEPYFTTKDLGKGTGMGLPVVHGIVKSHGGSIVVDSRPGEGATFELLFPRLERKTPPPIEDLKPLPTGQGTILFIDDEEYLVDLGEQMLNHLGYEVTTSMNPLNALKIFRTRPETFDLVITDMSMPKMSGERLVKEIRAVRSDVPIIMCTGFSEQMNPEKARAIGVSEFLNKPLVIRELARVITKVLNKPPSKQAVEY
ncbi:MAG: response regulator [Desulfobacterales bacterium]|nr:MAG: response regulator [Desulfobacterales bacterium]